MRLCARLVCPVLAIALATGLAACGGGGGDGSTTPTPPSGLITVKVNNVVVTPIGNAVTIGNGDTVSVEATRPVTWNATTAGALVTSNVVTALSWTARLAKPGTAALNILVQASAGTDSATVTFTIPQGDVRNGEYKLFSANFNEYRLRINFDAREYSLLSGTTVVSSGSFTEPVDGTYTFQVPGFAPVNNARFRTAGGVIVGSHPAGGSEAVPFVAANNFITAAADMPLTNMWIFMSDVTTTNVPPVNSRIQSLRIAASQITYCAVPSGPITTVANCLPANLSTYALTYNADRSITWLDDGVPVNLHVVRAGTEIFLIRAQSYPSGNKRFQVALDDARAVADGIYEGGASNGTWGTATIVPGAYSRSAIGSGGVAEVVSGPLASAGSSAQPLRVVTGSDGVPYFVQNTGVIGTLIAARGSSKAGQVVLGLKR